MKQQGVFNKIGIGLFAVLLMTFFALPEEVSTYQVPPKEIADLIDAPGTPYVLLSPDGTTLVIVERPSLSSIEEVFQPELRLAGLRINPGTTSRSRTTHYHTIKFKNLKTNRVYPISGLPEKPRISNFSWSPDGKKVAFTLLRRTGLELWMASPADGTAGKLTDVSVNGTMYGKPYQWFSDSKRILFKSVDPGRGEPPEKNPVPKGPVIQSNTGKAAPVRTYQDLLENQHDEALFVYYTTSRLMVVEMGKPPLPVGRAGIISGFGLSPDGDYILVHMIKPPFSYLVPYHRFPKSVEIWDGKGNRVKKIADIPLSEDIPKGFNACRTGPRSFTWRNDAPAEIYWVEAQDGGDPGKEAEIRDQLFCLEAPFTGRARPVLPLKYRFGGIQWGNGSVAMAFDWWWKTRKQRTVRFHPDFPEKTRQIIFDRSWEDRYNDPGDFVTRTNRYGRDVLLIESGDTSLYLTGQGASPEGNRPFIDRFSLKNGKTTRLWRSRPPFYESVVDIINLKKHLVLTRREGKRIQPNYHIRNLKTGKLKQVTFFPHPYPLLKNVEKQFITYEREDGLKLDGDLYLPPGYRKSDGPLPVLMWAYPTEYKSKKAAGQVTDSPYRFIRLYWGSPLLWITQGYAVFDYPKMPIVGEGDQEPNDTYVKQLVANAKAAIDKLVEMGVADRNRVAIGGHSYGAFMTANLLAHSELFAAGIARSGAYNRTLTPFGFQAEERTFWEAPEVYFKMSPFMHAQKIKSPILLIHGDADNNSGTFPLQSRRFYHALKGHGATVRLVILPFESHGYRARESIMHVAWETHRWLETYLKGRCM